MQLDDETQLLAGNAMINAMLKATGEPDKTKAMGLVAFYLDAETYLQDAGLLEVGVKAIESQTGINILRLADLSKTKVGMIKMANSVDPHIVLEELCSRATTRTTAALEALHLVLEKQSQSTPLDFSIATVGKLSQEQGGPSTQTIRNRTGKHFQQLIDAWAAYAGTTRKTTLCTPEAAA